MNNRPKWPRGVRSRRGFTMVELLAVIGIIVILVAILMPVVRSVRIAGHAAASQAAITALASAIERYRQDFGAYPGPMSNAQLTIGAMAGTTINPATPGSNNLMTRTENMVLGLVGGWEPPTSAAGAAVYDATKVGLGPMSHNPSPTARRRFPPYIDFTPGKNFQAESGVNLQTQPQDRWNRVSFPSTEYRIASNDTRVPEFVDAFPDPMPIIYTRARTGAGGVALDTVSAPAEEQYNPRDFTARYYATASPPNQPPVMFPGSSEDTNGNGRLDPGSDEDADGNGQLTFDFVYPANSNTPSVKAYFRNPSIGDPNNDATWQPRMKDAFILVGAGPDRRYGTRDDQTNFGPLK